MTAPFKGKQHWYRRIRHYINKYDSLSRVQTLCNPVDCSLLGSSIHGIFQAGILQWVAISFSRRSSQPRDWTWVSCIVGRCFTIWATREVIMIRARWAKDKVLWLKTKVLWIQETEISYIWGYYWNSSYQNSDERQCGFISEEKL